jgi:hypothetical protein
MTLGPGYYAIAGHRTVVDEGLQVSFNDALAYTVYETLDALNVDHPEPIEEQE